MDRIELSATKSKTDVEYRVEPRDVAVIRINGRDLVDMVREVEQPFADGEGHSERAAQYEGLPVEAIYFPSRLLLGEHSDYENFICEHEDKVQLYRCGGCGEHGCWPLVVRIVVTEESVIWSDFEQPHRCPSEDGAWRYDSLGPFVFDRTEYEAALRGNDFIR
jgi:hypothetical protein